MRKLKLFSLALMALFSTGLWAADPDLSIGATSQTSSSFLQAYATEGITISSSASYSSGAVQLGNTPSSYDAHYLEVLGTSEIDSIHFLLSGNGTNKTLQAPVFGWTTTATSNTANTYSLPAEQTASANSYAGAVWFKYDLTTVGVKCARIYRQTKNISSTNPEYTGSSTGLGNGNTIKIWGIKVWLHPAAETAPAITAPTTDQSATYTVGDAITALSVTASGNPAPTYQWYKNNSASTTGATSLGSSAQTASYTPDNSVASDLYYYCVATNSVSSATSPYFHVTVNAPSAPSHNITYNAESLKGQSVSGYPTEFYEGIGIASFDALPDVTNFHFNGWSPASIATTATTDQTIEAQWLPINSVTFTVGTGSGTAPEALAKWQGQVFNLPGQGSMVAPAGKAFDGWKAGGVKYAAGAEYTMGAAAVEFVAQWKKTPTTIFEWTGATTNAIESDNTDLSNATYGTLTTGTSVAGRLLGTNTIAKSDAGYKLGNDDVCIEIQGTSAFIEGDTVIITGKNGGSGDRCFTVAPSSAISAASSDTIKTNTISSQTDNSVYKVVIKEAQAGTKMRIFRLTGKTMYCKSIKVRRPVQKDIISSDTTLTAVTIAGESLALSNFSEAEPDSFVYIMDGEYVTPPTIVYTKHVVITYEDDSQLVKDINITPEVIDDPDMPEYFWASMITIGDEQYVINIAKKASYDAIYMNGSDTLGVQHIDATGSPTDEYIAFLNSKLTLATIAGWYTNSGLTDPIDPTTYTQANPSNPVNVTFYAKITYNHASSVNIEQLVLDNGTSYDLMAYMGGLNYATNIANSLDTLNDLENKANRNYAYLGLKVKAAGKLLNFRLASGSVAKVKFGAYSGDAKTPQVSINGGGYSAMTIDAKGIYSYTATGEDLISIKTATGDAVIFKQIMIDEDTVAVELPAPSAYMVNLNTPSNGKIAANWANKKYRAPIGTTVTLTATPDEGYKVSTITLDGEALTVTDNVATFVMPSKDVNVVATFVDVATALDNTVEEMKAVKVLENGQVVIFKDGKYFNVLGIQIR